MLDQPGWAMSKLDVTTQDLFLRLGTTSRTRSAKADALFRRLRMEEAGQIAEKLAGAPRKIDGAKLARSKQAGSRKAK